MWKAQFEKVNLKVVKREPSIIKLLILQRNIFWKLHEAFGIYLENIFLYTVQTTEFACIPGKAI